MVERIRREVLRLTRALGLACEEADGRAKIDAPGLAIAVEATDARVRVTLDGWSHEFVLGGDASDDEGEVDAALDLIGAALFGEVRVVVMLANGRAHRWTLELRDEDGWWPVSTCGSRSWRPFVARTSETRMNACGRPPGYAAIDVRAPASAPWLGRAGFAGTGDAGPVEVAIDGVLDLHSHSPKDVKKLVLAYLESCRGLGMLEVRIIHGKGVGHLRRTVHALLERHPDVVGFRLGGHGEGGWGATLVDLRPL